MVNRMPGIGEGVESSVSKEKARNWLHGKIKALGLATAIAFSTNQVLADTPNTNVEEDRTEAFIMAYFDEHGEFPSDETILAMLEEDIATYQKAIADRDERNGNYLIEQHQKELAQQQ